MKFLLIIFISLSSLVAKSAGGEEPVNPVVLESFQTTFGNNCNVSWSTGRYFFKAEFSFHGQSVSAFFTKTGNLIATAKNILFSELPLSLQMGFRNSYAGYWISDLFELTKEGETTYYLTLENGDQKVVLQSAATHWNLYEKKTKLTGHIVSLEKVRESSRIFYWADSCQFGLRNSELLTTWKVAGVASYIF